MTKTNLSLIFAALSCIAFFAFVVPQEQKPGAPWEIPEEYKNMENPHEGDASLRRLGKAGYSKHCRSCHGNKGLGDGPMSGDLETFPGDFTSEKIQNHTDGELYYMSFIGRDEMPNFESKIPDIEERWAIVNYLRTFAK